MVGSIASGWESRGQLLMRWGCRLPRKQGQLRRVVFHATTVYQYCVNSEGCGVSGPARPDDEWVGAATEG